MGKLRAYHIEDAPSVIAQTLPVPPPSPTFVEVEKIVYQDKIIYVDNIIYVDKPIEVIKEVPKEVIKYVPEVHTISEFVNVDRIVEKFVDRPVETIIEKQVKYIPKWAYIVMCKLALGHVGYILYHILK